MKNFIFLFLIIFSFCSKKNNASSVISKSEFSVIVKEMAEAEVYAQVYIAKDSTKKIKDETLKLYEKIFALHKTNKTQVLKSFNYYIQKPDEFKVMLDSLQTQARKLEIVMPIKKAMDTVK